MPDASQLAMRDPARAALLGALSGRDFGFGDDYGRNWYGFGVSAFDPSLQLWNPGMFSYGADGYGPSYYGYGAMPTGPSAPPARPMPAGSPAHAMQHHAMAHPDHPANPGGTWQRSMLLDPNRDSRIKVERYSFTFGPTANLVLGTASTPAPFTQQPSASIRPQRVIMNAPSPAFVFVQSLQVANVNVLIGGQEDAFFYSASAFGVILDLPRLDPQNRATGSISYSGSLPTGFTNGFAFTFLIGMQGPSTLAGGYGQ